MPATWHLTINEHEATFLDQADAALAEEVRARDEADSGREEAGE